jgi:tetratricopeptide (TPR) repeat protein
LHLQLESKSLNNLAKDYYYLGKYDLAEPLYLRAIATSQKLRTMSATAVAWYKKNYALLLYAQGKKGQAEPLFKEAMDIFVQNKHARDAAFSQYELAELYRRQKKYDEAEGLFKKAIPAMENAPGHVQYELAVILAKYASLLRETGRETEALPLEARAKELKSKYAPKS